jgi:hypothetical protein
MRSYSTRAPDGLAMLRSAYFTVMLAELGSAAETALKLEASAAKIEVAIRPRRPVEGDEVFIVVS